MHSLLTLAADPAAWVALAALVVMEIVLGIDNLVFIAILTNRMPEHQRESGRRIGIGLALILRLGLLSAIAIIVKLTAPVVFLYGHGFSWRDLILIAGGAFLLWKGTKEIHHRVESDPGPDLFDHKDVSVGFAAAMGQIIMLDLVFSLDSIITAVGMTEYVPIMVIAVIIAVLTMLMAATPLANLISANPTIVMLALGFLLMIGTALIAEAIWGKNAEGIYLCRDGFRGARRGPQHDGTARPEETQDKSPMMRMRRNLWALRRHARMSPVEAVGRQKEQRNQVFRLHDS